MIKYIHTSFDIGGIVMPLVPAICTQCGAQIEVDNSHEAGICKHCRTAFITEKAINKYTTNITNSNNFAGANININMNIVSELEQLVASAEGCQRLGEYEQAYKTYKTIIQKYPQDARGWLGCVKTMNEGFFFKEPTSWDVQVLEKQPFAKYYENACLLSDDNVRTYLENTKTAYVDVINKRWLEFKKVCSLQGLKNFIGNDVYFSATNGGHSRDYGYFEEWFYVLNGKLYYQRHTVNRYEVEFYQVYEVTSMDNNGNMHAQACFIYSDNPQEEDRKISYFHESTIVIEDGAVFTKTKDRGSISVAWEHAKNRQEGWKSKQKKGCYIATCVYGSYDCPQVWTLRRFRDFTLDNTWYGRLFIKSYYAISPSLVKFFGNKKWFKMFWRKCLDNMVYKFNQNGIEDTKYTDKY